MTHLSDFELDAVRIGQIDDDRRTTIEAHLAACEACCARYDALVADAAAFDIPLDTAATLAASDNVMRPSFGRRAVPFLIGAAAAAVFVFVVRPSDDTVRTKGAGTALELYVADGSAVKRAVGAVPTGATLRLRFDPGGKRYVRMWWGNEALWPARDAPAIHLDSTEPQWLDRPVQLDDDPSTEIVEALFCDATFDDDARQVFPDGCRHVQMEVTKQP